MFDDDDNGTQGNTETQHMWMILEPEVEADAATVEVPATPLEADAMEV